MEQTTTLLAAEKVYEEGRFEVFTIVERNNESYWSKVGRGYLNKDSSINLFLDALPTNGKLQIRKKEKREDRMPPAKIEAGVEPPRLSNGTSRGLLARGSLP